VNATMNRLRIEAARTASTGPAEDDGWLHVVRRFKRTNRARRNADRRGRYGGGSLIELMVAPLRAGRRRCRGRNRGFSLIELMVVLVILGLLTGLVGPRLFGRVDSSKVQTAETQIKMLRGALQTYRLDIGSYPSTTEGLEALLNPPADIADYWNGPYLEDELPLDPWRESYKYEHPADTMQGFALYSLGADSETGGEDLNADIGYLPK